MAKKRKRQTQGNVAVIQHLALPLECVVHGTPATLQSSSQRKKDWKMNVAEAIKTVRGPGVHCLPHGHWVRVQIRYYFLGPHHSVDIDVDNIIKPIMDAANRIIYQDDKQVIEVCSHRFSIQHDHAVSGNQLILEALAAGGEFVHIVFSSGGKDEFTGN
jgi:Holliday junction resolvase RusA-like endonuclease